jgi:hypothetical protein
MVIKLQIKLWLPAPVVRLGLWLLLLYRRLRYGYPFRRIKLTQGKFAIVDPEDYVWLSQYKWYARKSGQVYYAGRSFNISGKKFNPQMHRLIMEHVIASEAKQSKNAVRTTQYAVRNKLPDNLLIDHINNNGLDNRKINLRIVTQRQNCWNSRAKFASRSSRYKGVSWCSRMRKWVSKIKAYDTAAKRHRGAYAYLNFPQNNLRD